MQLNHHPPTAAHETILLSKRLVDAETGVIKMLYEAPLAPDAARIFGCAALCSDQRAIGFPSDSEISGSTSLCRDGAIVGAIGEAIERYCAAYTPHEKILHYPYAAVAGDAIEPGSLTLYDAQQEAGVAAGYHAPHHDEAIGWVEGWSLTEGRSVLVPAFCVYQPYTSAFDEPPVVQMVTTGLACGATIEEAILAGLCEVVERDAAMLLWLQSRRVPSLSMTSELPVGVAEAVRRFGASARYVHLLDATSDIRIPTYVAVWDGPIARHSGAVFSSCAKPGAEAAAVGAITELAQCLMWAASLIDGETRLPDPKADDFHAIEQHVLWPLRPDARPAWEFALASERRATFDPGASAPVRDVLETLENMVERVRAAGLQAVAVNVTSPDIAEVGLHVVRVVIPHAQPLFFGRDLHRISTRARNLPYADRAATAMNLHPHPYP